MSVRSGLYLVQVFVCSFIHVWVLTAFPTQLVVYKSPFIRLSPQTGSETILSWSVLFPPAVSAAVGRSLRGCRDEQHYHQVRNELLDPTSLMVLLHGAASMVGLRLGSCCRTLWLTSPDVSCSDAFLRAVKRQLKLKIDAVLFVVEEERVGTLAEVLLPATSIPYNHSGAAASCRMMLRSSPAAFWSMMMSPRPGRFLLSARALWER